MSFILDALKKSENERQRHIGPSLAEVRVQRRDSDRPWWAAAVAGLLLVNLGVLLVVLLRGGIDDSSTSAPPPARLEVAAPQESTNPSTRSRPAQTARAPRLQAPGPTVSSLADEALGFDPSAGAAAPSPDLSAAAAVPDGPPIVRPIVAPAVAPAAALDSRALQVERETLPTHGDLVAGGASLPELHLDIHVHSGEPAERFVFVNMRKYVEGQTLSEGSVLERITPDGAVLNHHGLRFLLPRQ